MVELFLGAAEWLGLAPLHVGAALLGLIVSWGGTQIIKKNFDLLRWQVITIAVLLGFAPAYTVAPGWGWLEFWIAMACGFCAPGAYKLLVAFASHRWEWVRELSRDKN